MKQQIPCGSNLSGWWDRCSVLQSSPTPGRQHLSAAEVTPETQTQLQYLSYQTEIRRQGHQSVTG